MDPNPTDSGRLRELRLAAGLTQQTVAERAGCSVSYIRLLEGGFLPTGGDVLPRVLDAIGEPQGRSNHEAS